MLEEVEFAYDVFEKKIQSAVSFAEETVDAIVTALPQSAIVGLAMGGDLTAPIRAAQKLEAAIRKAVSDTQDFVRFFATEGLAYSTETAAEWTDFETIEP